MFPGRTTRLTEEVIASAASISPKSDQVLLSGSTAIATILPDFLGVAAGILVIVPTDGAVATLTTGNIAVAVTMPQNRATVFTYSKLNDTWYPGAIS